MDRFDDDEAPHTPLWEEASDEHSGLNTIIDSNQTYEAQNGNDDRIAALVAKRYSELTGQDVQFELKQGAIADVINELRCTPNAIDEIVEQLVCDVVTGVLLKEQSPEERPEA